MKNIIPRLLGVATLLFLAVTTTKAQSSFACPVDFVNEMDCPVSFVITVSEKLSSCSVCALTPYTVTIPAGMSMSLDCNTDFGCNALICAASITWVSPGSMVPATINWSSTSVTTGVLTLPAGCDPGLMPRIDWAPSGRANVSR